MRNCSKNVCPSYFRSNIYNEIKYEEEEKERRRRIYKPTFSVDSNGKREKESDKTPFFFSLKNVSVLFFFFSLFPSYITHFC